LDTRTRKRLLGRAIAIVVGLALVGLIAYGFVPKPVPVSIGKVEKRPLEITVDETGKTRIRDKYVISAPVTGHMSRIALLEGDAVAEGAVVAEIAPLVPQLLDARTRAEAQARVEVAQANLSRVQSAVGRARTALTFAQTQAERSRKLRSEGGVSEQAYEEAEYTLRAAQDELESSQLAERVSANELAAARTALTSIKGGEGGAKLTVTAPVAGRVLRIVQESEGAVQAGAPLLEIGDPHALEVVVDVLTTDAVKISVGASARIERWGGDYPLAARVQRKEPSAFTTRSALGVEEQRVPVVLDIVEDPKRWTALGDGYRVESRIRIAHLENAVVVPASALFRQDGAWIAFAVKDRTAAKLSVEIGVRNADWAEVKKGLAEGDTVVLYPSDQVIDGVRVKATAGPAR
jgi:HlyD family secretion protein